MKKILLLFLVLPFCGVSQNNYISNKDYTEFVTYVKDSLFRFTMGKEVDEEAFFNLCHTCHEGYIPSINWKTKLDINSPEAREALEPWYYKPEERLNRKREFDTRKFIHNKVQVYPDVMIWCKDSTLNKSWATFLSRFYFTHPYFQYYPVYGLTEQQINEYLKWKHPKQNKIIRHAEKQITLKLPKEKLRITIGDYFEFYKYTRDSTIRMILCKEYDEWKYCKSVNEYQESITPPIVKWKYKIKWKDEIIRKILKESNILYDNDSIDNRVFRFDYLWIDFYAPSLTDSISRSSYFKRTSVNLGANKYFKEKSPIILKNQFNLKEILDYKSIDNEQLKAYYWWKKSDYLDSDVFEGFIPYNNSSNWEEDAEKLIKDNDVELLRTGKLSDSFYNFSYTIPVITIE